MTKVIKGEFEKIKDIKVKDNSLACDSPLEVFNCEVSRLSKMDDNLFTYEVEIANIPCDLRVNDSEHEADDMGFDPSDIAFIANAQLNTLRKLQRKSKFNDMQILLIQRFLEFTDCDCMFNVHTGSISYLEIV
ncbi:hypothetical protein Tco_1541381 [Tanacetum coccineum]